MAVNYDKLWEILRKKNWTRTKMREKAKMSKNALARMGKGEVLKMETLNRICNVLNVTVDDILDYEPDSEEEQE